MNSIDKLVNDFTDADDYTTRLAAIDALLFGEDEAEDEPIDEDELWREDQRIQRALIEEVF